MDYALEKGCVVVAAGGNDGIYPAAYPDVIGVAALDRDGKIWSGSNSGKHIKVSAPGVDIVSAGLGGEYTYASGSSTSAPMVTALAAMLAAERVDLSSAVVGRLITKTAIDLGEIGNDRIFGYGELDSFLSLARQVKPFHDVAVRSIHVEPMVFEKSKQTYIVAKIQNIGTYKSENIDIVLSGSYDGKTVELSRKNNITVMKKMPIIFEWLPSNSIEKIEFSVELFSTVDSFNDNNRNKTNTILVSENDDVYTLYWTKPPTHQWIAFQAYNKLSTGSLKTEIGNYLPTTSFF